MNTVILFTLLLTIGSGSLQCAEQCNIWTKIYQDPLLLLHHNTLCELLAKNKIPSIPCLAFFFAMKEPDEGTTTMVTPPLLPTQRNPSINDPRRFVMQHIHSKGNPRTAPQKGINTGR